jgi:lipid II:glycine glycyltransferase (peptidoglycan interpeptide bridge formation enzyme)
MRTRKQFETSVDVDEFGRIHEMLPAGQRMHTFLARKDGEAVAALVIPHIGDTGLYLLGATNEKARELKAAYFLQWSVMMWLKEHGARCYDLGGIDPEANPGGYHFKSGFNGLDVLQVPAHTCTGGWFSRAMTAFINWRHRSPSAARLVAQASSGA